jgi:hypothetical protein
MPRAHPNELRFVGVTARPGAPPGDDDRQVAADRRVMPAASEQRGSSG